MSCIHLRTQIKECKIKCNTFNVLMNKGSIFNLIVNINASFPVDYKVEADALPSPLVNLINGIYIYIY